MQITRLKPISVERAARRAKVTPRTIRNWIVCGLAGGIRLKAQRRGIKWEIDPADLDDFSRRLTEAAISKAGVKS